MLIAEASLYEIDKLKKKKKKKVIGGVCNARFGCCKTNPWDEDY